MSPELALQLTAMDPAVLGGRIKAARLAAGLTQPALAGPHASVAYLSRIESGQRRPSSDLVHTLAAKLGVTKVNIDTDGRLVWTRVHREYFRDKPAEFDFRPPGKIFIEEYAKFIASRNDLLGSSNQLDDLRKSLGK